MIIKAANYYVVDITSPVFYNDDKPLIRIRIRDTGHDHKLLLTPNATMLLISELQESLSKIDDSDFVYWNDEIDADIIKIMNSSDKTSKLQAYSEIKDIPAIDLINRYAEISDVSP